MRAYLGWLLLLIMFNAPVRGDDLPRGVSTRDPIVYHVKMTTTVVIPSGKREIENIRVWHALPNRRAWSNTAQAPGMTNLLWTPKEFGKKEFLEREDSHHVLFTTDRGLQPGAKLKFTSDFVVRSVTRTFVPKSVPVKWKDYEKKAVDPAAVTNVKLAENTPAELEKFVAAVKTKNDPARAVLEFSLWIKKNIRYDASVGFTALDMPAILKNRCGHCGHQAALMERMCAKAGIPYRMVWGLNLYAPDGKKGELSAIRADFTNVHTWAEVYFPGVGWVEIEPSAGDSVFEIPARSIRNNTWFQNYAIWYREKGVDKQPRWDQPAGKYVSEFGVENLITYTESKAKK